MATPYMSLTLPSPSVTVGPTWATELNTALGLVDSHDHTYGHGARVPSSGLNINADVGCNDTNLTALRSVRFQAQTLPLGLAADLGCLYVNGVDLYYNDGSGNQIPITAAGALSAASLGGISGLVAPAAVTYVAGAKQYTFSANTGTVVAGAVDVGPVTVRQANTAAAKGVTLQSYPALAADYAITLPAAVPASTVPVMMDSSGNLTVAAAPTIAVTIGGDTSAAPKSYVDARHVCAGSFSSAGVLLHQVNNGTITLASATHGSTGVYDIAVAGVSTSSILMATPNDAGAVSASARYLSAGVARVSTFSAPNSALVNAAFSFQVIML